jgi:hypothetical protein
MASFRNPSFGRMVEGTLKRTAAALRDAGVPFCLIGSMSAWARGGPESSHDLDFGIRREDVLRAANALSEVGMVIEVPPEDWLIKAWDGDPDDPDATLVDLIHNPAGMPITDEVLGRADELDVLAMRMRVLSPTDLLAMKLLALREHHLDLTGTMATARAIREQIDWAAARRRTWHSPYARGFFTMAEGLGLCPPAEEPPPDTLTVVSDLQRARRPARHPERERLLEWAREHGHLRPDGGRAVPLGEGRGGEGDAPLPASPGTEVTPG